MEHVINSTTHPPRAFVRLLSERFMARLARQQIASATLREALTVAERLIDGGWRVCLSPWKRPNMPRKEFIEENIAALCAAGRLSSNVTVSLKPSDLQYDGHVTGELFAVARDHDVSVQFDAQEPTGAEWAFRLLERSPLPAERLGCTLPARWRRSQVDAKRACDMGLSVRVVRGQWPDSGDGRVDFSEAYMSLIAQLAGRARLVRVATHNTRLARRSLQLLCGSGTEAELEQMFGLPFVRSGLGLWGCNVPVRIYVPYGYPYLPYRIADISRRPAIALWILRDLFARRGKNFGENWQ